MRTTTLTLTLVLAMTVAITACSGEEATESTSTSDGTAQTTVIEAPSPSPGSSANTLTVASKEFLFAPSDLQGPADTDVTVQLTNQGAVEHDWTIKDQDVTIKALPGQTASATFNLPAGSYTIYCSVPGHEAAGMTGTLTVG
jgi:nitrite reductase (NO-forming)